MRPYEDVGLKTKVEGYSTMRLDEGEESLEESSYLAVRNKSWIFIGAGYVVAFPVTGNRFRVFIAQSSSVR
jgi:hypothetical protein